MRAKAHLRRSTAWCICGVDRTELVSHSLLQSCVLHQGPFLQKESAAAAGLGVTSLHACVTFFAFMIYTSARPAPTPSSVRLLGEQQHEKTPSSLCTAENSRGRPVEASQISLSPSERRRCARGRRRRLVATGNARSRGRRKAEADGRQQRQQDCLENHGRASARSLEAVAAELSSSSWSGRNQAFG